MVCINGQQTVFEFSVYKSSPGRFSHHPSDMADSKNDEEKKADPRMAWVRPRIERGFANMKADKLKKSIDGLR